MEPTSDIQLLARLLIKTRQGDQLTAEEGQRLSDIAEKGHSESRIPAMPEAGSAGNDKWID